jgi:lipoate-protein ligase A
VKTILSSQLDPYFNLAMEDFWLRQAEIDDDLFYLWRNAPSVVVGRNQNPYREVRLLDCLRDDVPVIRRVSGGGAVYHDVGNVNFTFVYRNGASKVNRYEEVLRPIVDALRNMGIPATFREKSELEVGGLKISGNAQGLHKGRILHHGTLLFDADLERLGRYLHNREKTTEGPSVPSNPANVGLLNPYWLKGDVVDFMEELSHQVERALKTRFELRPIAAEELNKIETLAVQRYRSFEWNYGETPPFTKRVHDACGDPATKLLVENGVIVHVESCRLEWRLLKDCSYAWSDLKSRLEEHKVKDLETFLDPLFE